jgi:hypothetical protein
VGKYDIKIGHSGCIGYKLSFNRTGALPSIFKGFPCSIKTCSVDSIQFTCWKNDTWNMGKDVTNYRLFNNLDSERNGTSKPKDECMGK